MNLKDIDLNLLVVFNQLLIDKKVSTAAEHLNLTQPAVSNALRRLRNRLSDELFIRTSRGMEPTAYAMQLAEPVACALNTLQSALSHRSDFDPLSSEKTFSLALTDIGEIYFTPLLMKELSKKAPKVKITTARQHPHKLREAMEAGTVDLAIGLLPALQTGFFQRRLFSQNYVCVYRKDHPIAQAPLSLETFGKLEHISVISANTGHGEVDVLFQRLNIQRNIRITVPHFTAVGHILQDTDLVATLPERLAEQSIKPFGLELSPHPAPLPTIAINLFWHARFHRDPENQWFRELIFDTFLE